MHAIHKWEWHIISTNMPGIGKMIRRCEVCGLEKMPKKSLRR